MSTEHLSRETWTPANAEDRALVLAALEEIIASGVFHSSRRYPAMLRYIVEKTLANEEGSLKERTIGIAVFGRNPAYDTSVDPVVRFSAGEVRKRIAQFYRENEGNTSIELEIPLGTYVPRFYRWTSSVDPPDSSLQVVPHTPDPEPALPPQSPGHFPVAVAAGRAIHWPIYLFAVLILAAAIIGILVFKDKVNNDPEHQDPRTLVWAPLLRHAEPILISAGRPHAEEEQPPRSNITIGDEILRPEFRVTIPTLNAIINIAGFLRAQNKPFRVHEAYSNSLTDLHDRPVILITGNDNKWTRQLLQPLRFHFVQQGDFSYIEDSQRPGFHDWNVDFAKPFHTQTVDYAIVARFISATTGGPVMVIAGISSNGTEAAGEFIVSPQAVAKLERTASPGAISGNFEAVLKVEVIDGNTGSATLVASQFW